MPGWEARLATVLRQAARAPYVLGEHDCFRVACAAVEALTGVDHWEAWRGTYATRAQALRRIVEYHPDGFTAAFSRLFGGAPEPLAYAQRGDIAEFADGREQHLGIVCGATVAVLGETGLVHIPRSACAHAWSIG